MGQQAVGEKRNELDAVAGLLGQLDVMQAAALQYVRKISGYRTPSRANEAAFNAAVEDIAVATRALLSSLHSRSLVPRSQGRGSPGPDCGVRAQPARHDIVRDV